MILRRAISAFFGGFRSVGRMAQIADIFSPESELVFDSRLTPGATRTGHRKLLQIKNL
jgi:hypothetical protein